ncbi:diguanylate cyclase [Sphingomonas populi]|uniref:Diguanylate cyclase n=1 Tax=Sphingomonas populi TaxID=2484750 RepID=A0A4V2DCY4_9SPHN|nr:sensor domain-containing diguanylate cyclase [Sphingomonas populi]RZF63098.1 diguanylate cyclase [Sphingomonas populi]
MIPTFSEALYELCGFARVACDAALVMALEVDDAGRATPVASSPPHHFTGFNLDRSGVFDTGWSHLPLAADSFRLPTAVVHALPDRPASLLFVPAPVDHAPKSGLLLFWTTIPPTAPLIQHVPLLASSVANTLMTRREAARQMAMRDQFNDLLDSVPSGIVLFDGDGQSAVINQRAADLLAAMPGPHRARDLAAPMRALRARCDNHAALDTAYAAHVGNVNYAVSMHWIVGERTYEVDTHPVSGDGQHGRIWLFTDVTAELQLSARLRGLADSDSLTGLSNRRYFEQRSAQIITAAQGDGRGIAILMVDVDHFKQINDTYGHPVGDEVLKAVAARCQEALREHDLIARFGGEEFVVLLATSGNDEAGMVAERLRQAIARVPIAVGDVDITVSVSIGAATRDALDGNDRNVLQMLVARADSALYDAKRDGRNCVRISPGT